MLTGYSIDVYRDIQEGEEDIYLDEFRDEIDDWVIETLKDLGLGTAKAVLNAPREVLDQADLEDATLENVLNVLRAEFED
jgi:N utilization substance protein A